MHKVVKRLIIIAGVGLPGGPAWTLEIGALDGQWCSPDGQIISVSGTSVIAPNGVRTTGTYDKHAFLFTEPGQNGRFGRVIWMEPKGKDAARVSVVSPVQKEPPPHDRWRRCGIVSSEKGTQYLKKGDTILNSCA